jgi:hypothetical protein
MGVSECGCSVRAAGAIQACLQSEGSAAALYADSVCSRSGQSGSHGVALSVSFAELLPVGVTGDQRCPAH